MSREKSRGKYINQTAFESQNSLKLSFTNIRALHSNFDEYESLLNANFPEILTYYMALSYGWGSTASLSNQKFMVLIL